ncbi:MAG TPA: lysyl oxidase family protein [Acidimicrobiales bacterium]|nr:lysyl oxidase family protein [Acidimicrobiales bacterium]
MRQPRSLVTSLALGTVLLVLAPAAAGAAAPRLPDLGMAPLRDFVIDRSGGARLLRFTTEIVNVGTGRFALSGRRSSTSFGMMSVRQLLSYDDGSVGTFRTQAVMEYSGDGHDHWHVRDLERYTLQRVGSSREVGRGAKAGFCFFESDPYRLSLPGAPASPVYLGCGSQASTTVEVGLSVGWGDVYPWHMAFQWIDLTGLPSGDYIVRAQADPHAYFTEATTANNATWTRIRVSATDQVTVLEQGPAA